jgi:glutamine synthetase adenylyltransferase
MPLWAWQAGREAIGYASDLEILFIYSDRGRTDGEKQITNAEFFELMVRGIYHFIEAKREGIFQVDLRLRPMENQVLLRSAWRATASIMAQAVRPTPLKCSRLSGCGA